jgi:hypothetical protein
VVDNINKAKKALADARLSYTEADVLRIELPNKAWGASEIRSEARGQQHQHHPGIPDEHQGLQQGKHGASGVRFRQGSPPSIMGE